MTTLLGEYLKENYPGLFYSKGQNIRRLIVKEYADALEKYDVVAMPTIPWAASKLPEKNMSTFGELISTK